MDKSGSNSVNLKSIGFPAAYFISGTLLIEILNEWAPFNIAFGVGMGFCFLISLLSKLKMGTVLILSVLYCLLILLDNSLSIYWISDVKQSDWMAVAGSGVIFSVPGILGSIVNRLFRIF